jgi:hypothetical protein
MAQVYDPEELKNAEERASGQPGSSSSSTARGKVKYSSDKPKTKAQSDLSTSTSPGEGSYDSSSDIPQSEQSLYRSSSTKSSKVRYGNLLNGRRNKFIAGGLVTATIAGVSIAIFLALVPLKILHIVNNLQSHFYASSQNAIQKESNQLLSRYVKRNLFSQKCGRAVIDKNCTPLSSAIDNPIERLYKGWRDARLEDKLAQKYGLEFSYNKSSGHYSMKAPGLGANGVEIDDFVNSEVSLDEYIKDSPNFQKVSRSQLRQAVSDSFSTETRWKTTMYRFKVARLLEQKYGIPRCIIFCTTRDRFADSVQNQKNAAKIVTSRLVFETRNQELNIAIKCLLDPNCNPTDYSNQSPCEPGVNCELNNAPENKDTDKPMRIALEDLAAKYGIEDTASLVALYTELEEKGLSQYMIEKVFAYVFGPAAGETAAQNISDALPIIGWMNLAFQTIDQANNAGPKLKKLDYLVNSASAVSMFATYRVYADEIKTGKVNATEVGSLVNSLGPVAKNGSGLSNLKGGTAAAEQTPLYSYLIDGGNVSGSSNYKCANGKPPAGGSIDKAVCQEEKPGQGNEIANFIHDILNLPGFSIITTIATIWHNTVGAIFSWTGDIIALISGPAQKLLDATCVNVGPVHIDLTGYCAARDAIKGAATYVADAAINYLIPNPFGTNMSGGRTFDMMAAGADVSGNDYSHNGLGGQMLSSQQTSAILNEQNSQELQHYQSQSFFARMFDTSSNYSPATKLAMALPSNAGSLQTSMASWLTNPFSKLGGLGSIFHPRQAFAATTAVDPFGITQYGYADNDPIFQSDPEVYWDAHCSDKPSQAYQSDQDYNNPSTNWNNLASSGQPDPVTGMPVNTTTNPCILIKATVGSAGAIYDSGLLTADDLAGSSQPSNVITSSSGTSSISAYQNPLRDVPNLYPKRIDEGVDYGGDGPVYAIGSAKIDFFSYPNSGWTSSHPGLFLSYTLTDGPAAGKSVYVAEHCNPTKTWKVGDLVTSGTILCKMVNSDPWIETGWAPGGQAIALAKPVYTEGHATLLGVNFDGLMQKLGAPAGTYDYPGETPEGPMPAGWPSW